MISNGLGGLQVQKIGPVGEHFGIIWDIQQPLFPRLGHLHRIVAGLMEISDVGSNLCGPTSESQCQEHLMKLLDPERFDLLQDFCRTL